MPSTVLNTLPVLALLSALEDYDVFLDKNRGSEKFSIQTKITQSLRSRTLKQSGVRVQDPGYYNTGGVRVLNEMVDMKTPIIM